MTSLGSITRVSGAVVEADCRGAVALGEVVRVGAERLLGEVIALRGGVATAQIYEETDGLAAGDPFEAAGEPLLVELGPGLLGQVFDGVQRPLDRLAAAQGDFLRRGAVSPALDRDRLWPFQPLVQVGQWVDRGTAIGTVPETASLQHRVLVPPSISGEVAWITKESAARVDDVVARVGGRELRLFHSWRVRARRPVRAWLPPSLPMITGQRVLDTLFPLPLGGSAGLPGGFGTGKTVLQHQLCKWADADVIVYVACGERGNEITHMLRDLPRLTDPRTGRPLSERTIIVANTSNMPVAARESSIFTAVTIAEYYRDMGYRVAVLADSTSRWAEALREISGRLGQMPAEEGYPPDLPSRLAAFYERAGRAQTLEGREGSVTLISAISPAGGDLTEPVTRHTQAFTRTFWTLDKDLAAARSYPAVGVQASWGDVPEPLEVWWEEHGGHGWGRLRKEALALLGEAAQLEATARLLGADSLPERQRFLLGVAGVLEEAFLQQSAFDAREARDEPPRQFALLRAVLHFRDRGLSAIERGKTEAALLSLPVAAKLRQARAAATVEEIAALEREIDLATGE
ncbi:MAG TPA: V-type ATP synthase subunit A [Myxococcales bacterium]